ncbi:ABC transporter substrate-binding protein [Paracoccus onubensis]|uniref:ABC transporter substrate-binding protein n=1 Tax=Paracoccus onubensis TaxID=1675788 RepID=UPI00272F0B56|nr:ABC transporter substrate-binding protein [Paracoccus onubensis]MDP0929502.1 ABC transporter substrate-binding protein [Paracoccus onubensis]
MRYHILTCATAIAAVLQVAMPAMAEDVPLKVGVTVVDMGNPFFGAIASGIDSAVKELGGEGSSATIVSGDYDLAKQSSQFDNFIQAGVDMIIVSAVDSQAIGGAVKRAESAGIPVIAVDNTASGAGATITTDNVTAGKQACQYIAEQLDGKGNVIIVNGPQVSGVIDRVEGCKEVLSEHSDIAILSDNQNGVGTRDGGLEVTTGLLIANPDVAAIFTINDPSAIGADLAAKQLNREGIIITTVDGSPDIVDALTGDTMIVASSAQLPRMLARAAVEAGIKLKNGETIDEPVMLVAPELITRDNVAQYQGWDAEQ